MPNIIYVKPIARLPLIISIIYGIPAKHKTMNGVAIYNEINLVILESKNGSATIVKNAKISNQIRILPNWFNAALEGPAPAFVKSIPLSHVDMSWISLNDI